MNKPLRKLNTQLFSIYADFTTLLGASLAGAEVVGGNLWEAGVDAFLAVCMLVFNNKVYRKYRE